MPVAPSQEARNPYLRADSLDALLAWDDVDFVRCAYVTLLGRQPDAAGEAYYASRIRRGQSKLALLRQLRYSDEARSHDPGIAGLDRALKADRIAQWPVIGHLIRMWTGHEGNGPVQRRLRMIDNDLAVLRMEMTRAVERSDHGPLLASIQQLLGNTQAPPRDPEPRFITSPARRSLSPAARSIFDRVAQP